MESAASIDRDESRTLLDALQVGGGGTACPPYERGSVVKTSRFFRITFPERGKPVLNIGPGDHTVDRWNLSMEEIRGLVLDCLPELLNQR